MKENLSIFIQAAKARDEALDHVLLYGPPGLGKTTLSNIIANEMNVNIRVTSGPAIEKPGDLAALLTNLNQNDVLFIDEIHRLSRAVEEVPCLLYTSLYDIICVIEGDCYLSRCLDAQIGCNRQKSRTCKVRREFHRISKMLRDELSAVTVDTLI